MYLSKRKTKTKKCNHLSHREDCYLLYRENSYLMQPQFLKSNFYYIVFDFFFCIFVFLYFLSNMLWLLYDRSGVKIVGCLRCIIKTKNINISVDVDADIAKVYGLDRLSLICVSPSFVYFLASVVLINVVRCIWFSWLYMSLWIINLFMILDRFLAYCYCWLVLSEDNK